MRKHFLTICFTIFLGLTESLCAQPIKLNNFEELKQREALPPPMEVKDPNIPDGSDIEAVEDFIKKRLQDKKVIIDSVSMDELNGISSMNVQHSTEYIQEMQQQNKSAFEKIYDEAIKRATSEEELAQQQTIRDQARLEAQKAPQRQQWQQQQKAPNFPVINISLPPFGKKILVPAQEHIPFLFSEIDILGTGQISITDTVVVVANGKKLAHGLIRALPKYSVSRDGKRHKIDINLNSVSINNTLIPHKVVSQGNFQQILPEQEYNLAPGVYTYRFSYVINRNLWEYNDFNEIYWDITGSSWNLIVARSGAFITLPGANKPLGQIAFSGTPGQLRNDVIIEQNSLNSIGVISTVPLFAGEGLHFIISLPKADFTPPDWQQKLSWFLSDYGNIIISLFAAAAIIGAYALSWKRKDISRKKKLKLKKTAPFLRYLSMGLIDEKSFSSFLLELFRQKRIDMEEKEGKIQLIKKSDSTKGLSRNEQKALKALFPESAVTLEIKKENALKIKRSFSFLQKDVLKQLKNLQTRLNLGYLSISILMLIIAEISIALLGNDFGKECYILLSCSFSLALAIWFFRKDFKRRWLNLSIKISSVISIGINLFVLSLVIHGISALAIFAAITGIFVYTKRFSQRNGLLKNYVEEAQKYKNYLSERKESISFGNNFNTFQANIHAVDADDLFPENDRIKASYKLQLAKKLDTLVKTEKLI